MKTKQMYNKSGIPESLRGMGWVIWHPVDGMLAPDDDMTVLIALSDGEVWTGYRDAGDWRFVSGDLVSQGSATVTHWAEFPDPPTSHYQTDLSTSAVSNGGVQETIRHE